MITHLPACEEQRKPNGWFLSRFLRSARRVPEANGITFLSNFQDFRKKLLRLYGSGPSTIPKLKSSFAAKRLTLKK